MPRSTADSESSLARHAALLDAVRRIPFGRVASYGQIARVAGYPRHARLVGRLLAQSGGDHCGAALPWHRVLNARGESSLTGAARTEQWRRLRAEGVQVREQRVDLRRYGWHVGGDSPLLD